MLNKLFLIFLVLPVLVFSSCAATSDESFVTSPSYTLVRSRYYYVGLDTVKKNIYSFLRDYGCELVNEDSYHVNFSRIIKTDNFLIAKEVQYKVLVFKDADAIKVTLNIFEVSDLGRNIEPDSKISSYLYKEFWSYLDSRIK